MTIFSDDDDDKFNWWLILMIWTFTLLVTSTLIFSTKKRTLFSRLPLSEPTIRSLLDMYLQYYLATDRRHEITFPQPVCSLVFRILQFRKLEFEIVGEHKRLFDVLVAHKIWGLISRYNLKKFHPLVLPYILKTFGLVLPIHVGRAPYLTNGIVPRI
jgi:hypothetical protein